MTKRFYIGRREFLHGMAVGTAALAAPGAFAEALTRTPAQTEGPFYPNKLPLDTDNDLIILNDNLTQAVGEITHLAGRVLSASGEPIRNAEVEIWQVDNAGCYIHTNSPNQDQRDTNFQGFGRFLTNGKGEYYFRTIKPVPYTVGARRTPHIHFAVNKGSDRLLTTQMYVKGHPMNEKDGIYRSIRDEAARESITIDFTPLQNSKAGELQAQFDIALGLTPEER